MQENVYALVTLSGVRSDVSFIVPVLKTGKSVFPKFKLQSGHAIIKIIIKISMNNVFGLVEIKLISKLVMCDRMATSKWIQIILKMILYQTTRNWKECREDS